MKTIIYLLIAVLVFGSIATGYTHKANPKITILIQSIDRHINPALLAQSVEIISGRLKDLGSEKFDITLIPEKKQIQIVLMDTLNTKAVENLLIQKGRIAFYETYDRKQLAELLKDADHLFSLLNSSSDINSSGRIGCTTVSEVAKVNDFLPGPGLNQLCKFAWSPYSDHSDVCLYALRLDPENGALLSGKDVESVKCKTDKASDLSFLEINFIESSAALWSDVTRRNINRDIAIVLDDVVISAPVVREVINNGSCQITGNFTPDEARYMAALCNNGELPGSFKIIK
jgi:SecD/SecF fusion protein